MPTTALAVKEITQELLKGDAQVAVYSPRQVVPFLVNPDGSVVLEAGAILMHVLETFDSTHKLHPAPGHKDRPAFLQAVFFGLTEGYKLVMGVFHLCMRIEKKDREQDKLVLAKKKFEVFMEHLIKQLDGGKKAYYLGDEFSAADIIMGYILMTSEYCDEGLLENELVKAYHARLKSRNSYKKLFAPC